MIPIYEDSPLFVSGVEFSGADGNVLRNNAIFLDAISQQPIPLFVQGLYKEAYQGMTINPVTGEQPYFWRGAFQYRTGVDTATYTVSSVPVTNERLRIYHNKVPDAITDPNAPGTLVYDAVMPGAITAININLASAGYSDGDIIQTFAQAYFPGPTYPKTGVYLMRNAITSGVAALQVAYGGVPTFGAGSTVTAANLNQLANAQDWIMSRFSLIPRTPLSAGLFVLGTHKSDVAQNPRVLYVGQLNKGNSQDTFHGVIDYYIFNGEEKVQVYIGGVLYYTSALLYNTNVGTLDFTFDISGLANNTNHTVVIYENVTVGQGQADLALYGTNIIPTRFTIRKIEATASRSYYTPSAEFDVLESMTYATLKSRLNNFVTGTTNAYTRINSNPNLFNEMRMFRGKLGWDNRQLTSLNFVNAPTQVRIGERYVVAGKDVKIAWGGYSLKHPLTEKPEERDIYEFHNIESLTGSDKVEVKEGFFDAFEGLWVGTQYYILGQELIFFSEYLR